MEELCTGCLIPGNSLRFLDEEKTQIYLAQLPDDLRIELMSIKFSFCFRCTASIHKIHQFQQLSTWAMQKLLSYHNTFSLGDLSDRPYFSQFDISKQSLIDIPSETLLDDHVKLEKQFEKDIFNETLTDTIKTENETDIIDIVENDIDITDNDIDADYHCEPDSFINDLLLSKLNSYSINVTEKSDIVNTPNEISSKKLNMTAKKYKNTKVLITKKPKTRKKANLEMDIDENSHSESNEDITHKNDDITHISDTTKKKSKITITESDKIKPDIITITLNESQINEERKKMSYKSDFTLSHFKCKSCIIGFDTIADYDKHFAEFHDEKLGPEWCAICLRRFPSGRGLKAHVSSHNLRYRCSLCGDTSDTRKQADAHARGHASCQLCGSEFGTMLQLQVHMNKAHGHKLQCTQCDKEFKSGKTLRYHLKVLHKGQNRHPCPHCGKVYQWKSNLFRHIKNHKAQTTGELHCVPCDKSFSSVATYRQHLATSKSHATPQQYSFSCSDCDRKFVLKRDLVDHINWEHLHKTVHVCAQCNKPFKSYMALYLHQNVHKAPAERGNLCHLCGKVYPTQSKLKSHLMAKHSDIMPYKCTLCDSAFNWYSSLYRHAHKMHGLTKAQYKVNQLKRPEHDVVPVVKLTM